MIVAVHKQLKVGLILELLVLALSYLLAQNDSTLFFQLAARYSGRVSLVYFSIFFIYSTLRPKLANASGPDHTQYTMAKNFAILHVIHWFLLAVAVYLSGFNLVPFRLFGGAVAYAMIVALPVIIQKNWIKASRWPLLLNVYLFYVWVIFMGTYAARIKNFDDYPMANIYTFWLLTIYTIGLMLWRIYHLAMRKH